MLLDIQSAQTCQLELDMGEPVAQRDRSRLMAAMDKVNDRWGKGSIKVGSARVGTAPRDWGMKQERRTPCYTTEWRDMPAVKA